MKPKFFFIFSLVCVLVFNTTRMGRAGIVKTSEPTPKGVINASFGAPSLPKEQTYAASFPFCLTGTTLPPRPSPTPTRTIIAISQPTSVPSTPTPPPTASSQSGPTHTDDRSEKRKENQDPSPIPTTATQPVASPTPQAKEPEQSKESKEPKVCAQVITRACQSGKRGESETTCQDFPTPCDVPSGWHIIYPNN